MGMIHIEIRDRNHDLNAEARKLIAEGNAARSDRIVFTRAGKPAISGNAGWWADHTVREDVIESPRFVRWEPFPPAGRRALREAIRGGQE
jgi:hypothetical protein